MADIALDADALRRDRQRYADLLEQAERQIAAWNERADHLQQAVDGFDHLLALSGDDPARDGGVPRRQVGGRGAAPPTRPAPPPPAPVPDLPPSPPAAGRGPGRDAERGQAVPSGDAGSERPSIPTDAGSEQPETAGIAEAEPPRGAGRGAGGAAPVEVAPPVGAAGPATAAPVTPAAPESVDPPGTEVPKGTDALRLVFESDVARAWTLAELIAALGSRGWLPTSRRPEEGVRISLKRLAERGGATRTDDGRWRLAHPDGLEPSGAEATGDAGVVWPRAAEPPSATAPAAQAAPAAEQPDPEPPAPADDPRPAPVGPRPGGTITRP